MDPGSSVAASASHSNDDRPAPHTRSLETYDYQPLESKGQIRLLRITENNTNGISCDIIRVDIESAPSYLAISYVWGDPSISHTIIASGKRLGVTASLHSALVDIAGFLDNKNGVGSYGAFLWADAICINQRDVIERGHQVPLMKEIYSKAAAVITYMGPEDDDTQVGITLLLELIDFYNKHTSGGSPAMHIAHRAKLESFGLPPSDDPKWAALRKLLLRPWSRRAWIVQESVVNNVNFLLCGRTSLPRWDILSHLVEITQEGFLPYDCIFDRNKKSEEETMDQGLAADRLYTLSQLRHNYQSSKGLDRSLCQLLRTTHTFECSDPRDKIYALYHLAKDRAGFAIVPDYTKSVEEVYSSVAAGILQSERTLDLFNALNGEKKLLLPSWVPDWSHFVKHATPHRLLFHAVLRRDEVYRASGNLCSEIRFNHDCSELILKGAVIDHVFGLVHHPLLPIASLDQQLGRKGKFTPDIIMDLLVKQAKSSTPENRRSTGSPKEILWRTLIANMTHEGQEAIPEYEAYFDAYERLCKSILTQGLKSVNRDVSWDEKTQLMGFQFARAIHMANIGQLQGVTTNGYLCSLPTGTKPHDAIAVLRGGRVPYVLRPGADGKYHIIGHAYVHELMKGEILQFNSLSDDITLV